MGKRHYSMTYNSSGWHWRVYQDGVRVASGRARTYWGLRLSLWRARRRWPRDQGKS